MELTNKTILLAEDDSVLSRMYQKGLTLSGANVLRALNGKEAIKIVNEEHIDLILLDLMMPVMNGYETIRQIRTSEKTKNIPIVVLTNLDDHPEFIEKATGVKIEAYLVKSNVSVEDVIQKISELIK
ncbi:MAG: Response regulator DrrA [Parcubacteria group bacterium LiPW_41]|nr:MAG: Response regulator DrrA [Parcubacteria group bacterium LiPW_41]